MISEEQNKLLILSDRNKINLKKYEIESDSCSDINSDFGNITSTE
jgi:hypothetical protein